MMSCLISVNERRGKNRKRRARGRLEERGLVGAKDRESVPNNKRQEPMHDASSYVHHDVTGKRCLNPRGFLGWEKRREEKKRWGGLAIARSGGALSGWVNSLCD